MPSGLVARICAVVFVGVVGACAGSSAALAGVVGSDFSLVIWRSGPPREDVRISATEGEWLVRDAGPTPITIGNETCQIVADQNSARCPPATVPADWRLVQMDPGDALRKNTQGTELHAYVNVDWGPDRDPDVAIPGAAASIDVRDGVVDEVTCEEPAQVMADGLDRVWGDCTILNGRRWQRDTMLSASARDFDVLGPTVAWLNARGRISLRAHGATRRLRVPGRDGRPQRLTLGRDGAGAPVAVFARCGPKVCERWYALRLGDRHVQRLHPKSGRACDVESVALWRDTLTSGQTCGRNAVVRVRRQVRGRVVFDRRVRQRRFSPGPYRVRVAGRGTRVALYAHGDVVLMNTRPGARCATTIDSSSDSANISHAVGQPLLVGTDLIWPSKLQGIGGGVPYDRTWVTIAPRNGPCGVDLPRARYVIVGTTRMIHGIPLTSQTKLQAAAIMGGRLVFLDHNPQWLDRPWNGLHTRPLETVGSPLSPFDARRRTMGLHAPEG